MSAQDTVIPKTSGDATTLMPKPLPVLFSRLDGRLRILLELSNIFHAGTQVELAVNDRPSFRVGRHGRSKGHANHAEPAEARGIGLRPFRDGRLRK